MKAILFLLTVCLFWQPLEAQTDQYFKKTNDSTVYLFESITEQFKPGAPIPAVVNGYSGPHMTNGDHMYVLIRYEKPINSFRLVGGECAASKYEFRAAYNNPGNQVTTSEWQRDRSYSNFFTTKTYVMAKERLSFDQNTKTFTLKSSIEPEVYFPWVRWAIAVILFFMLYKSVEDFFFNFLRGDKYNIGGNLFSGSFIGGIASGVVFFIVFSVGNVPWPNILGALLLAAAIFILFLLIGFIRFQKVQSKQTQSPQTA